MDMNRRQFFRVSSAGLVGSSIVALGFSPTAALAEARNFKLKLIDVDSDEEQELLFEVIPEDDGKDDDGAASSAPPPGFRK